MDQKSFLDIIRVFEKNNEVSVAQPSIIDYNNKEKYEYAGASGGFIDFFDDDTKFPLKKNVLATNSSIHDELKVLISKKVIE